MDLFIDHESSVLDGVDRLAIIDVVVGTRGGLLLAFSDLGSRMATAIMVSL